jgi:hypothetical protein
MVLDDIDSNSFNEDEASQAAFVAALVDSLKSVTSADQISNVKATAHSSDNETLAQIVDQTDVIVHEIDTTLVSVAESSTVSFDVAVPPGGSSNVNAELTDAVSSGSMATALAQEAPADSILASATVDEAASTSAIAADSASSADSSSGSSDDDNLINLNLCFPKSATVQSESFGTVPISSLQVGDRVMTLQGYSEVLLFSMRREDIEKDCVTVSTATKTLTVSHRHAILLDNGSVVQAQRLRVGDALLSSEKILEISASRCIGLIAPVTAAGTLLVDGVATSDYGLLSERLGQSVAHALVAPIRLARWLLPGSDWWYTQLPDGRHPLIMWGQRLVKPILLMV